MRAQGSQRLHESLAPGPESNGHVTSPIVLSATQPVSKMRSVPDRPGHAACGTSGTQGTTGFDIGVWGEHGGSFGIHILKQTHELPPAERAVEEALSFLSELCRDTSDARSDLSR